MQKFRGRGVLLILLAWMELVWFNKFHLAVFIIMLIVGIGVLIYSFISKEDEDGNANQKAPSSTNNMAQSNVQSNTNVQQLNTGGQP